MHHQAPDIAHGFAKAPQGHDDGIGFDSVADAEEDVCNGGEGEEGEEDDVTGEHRGVTVRSCFNRALRRYFCAVIETGGHDGIEAVSARVSIDDPLVGWKGERCLLNFQ